LKDKQDFQVKLKEASQLREQKEELIFDLQMKLKSALKEKDETLISKNELFE
jgi:hypothetical protein